MNQINDKNILHLINTLSDFGLNPMDWDLQSSENQIVELIHIEDPEIRIRGKYENMQWSWLEFAEI
jgi:hypothetical protein